MPKNFNPKNLAILRGIVRLKGGVHKVVSAVAGHKPGDTISEARAIELAEFLTPPMSELDRVLVAVPSTSSYVSSKCEHGNDPSACSEGECYWDDYDD